MECSMCSIQISQATTFARLAAHNRFRKARIYRKGSNFTVRALHFIVGAAATSLAFKRLTVRLVPGFWSMIVRNQSPGEWKFMTNSHKIIDGRKQAKLVLDDVR